MGNTESVEKWASKTFASSLAIQSAMKSFIEIVSNLQEDLPHFEDAMKATKARIIIFYEDGVLNKSGSGRIMMGDAHLLAEDLEELRKRVLKDTKE